MKKSIPLYSISVAGSQKKSYLFGTMHLASADAFTFIDIARSYIQKCAVFVGETDLGVLHHAENPFILPDNTTLESLLGKKKFEKAAKILAKAFDIDLSAVQHFNPMFVQNMIAQQVLTTNHGLALDFELHQYALKINLICKGLETIEEQFQIAKSYSLEAQQKSFLTMVKNVGKFRQKALKMSACYRDGNYKALYKMSKKQLGNNRSLMLYNRNAIMADRITAYSQTETCFFAIGAAHLYGKKGVLALLKSKGFVVKEISLSK